MPYQVYADKETASQAVFELFKEELSTNPQTVFGLATGSTPEKLYQLLRESDLDFSQATSINLDEYYGLPADHPQSYHYFMQKELFAAKPFRSSYLPDGSTDDPQAEVKAYEAIIDQNPIQVQILGIGHNGHIGFNEPGSPFDSLTRLVDLTQSTIEANQRFFDSIDEVPTQALSMGIASIMKADKVILMAFGEEKAKIVQAALEGPVTEEVPASILQNHPNAHFILDQAAAKYLK